MRVQPPFIPSGGRSDQVAQSLRSYCTEVREGEDHFTIRCSCGVVDPTVRDKAICVGRIFGRSLIGLKVLLQLRMILERLAIRLQSLNIL